MAIVQPGITSNFYQLWWTDSFGRDQGSRFYAANDTDAAAIAGAMAGISGCQVKGFFYLRQLDTPTTAAPATGANGDNKTWFHYRTAANRALKVHVPAVKSEYLELGGKKTAVDRIGAVGKMQSASGYAVTAFVQGLNNYNNSRG